MHNLEVERGIAPKRELREVCGWGGRCLSGACSGGLSRLWPVPIGT